MSPWRLLSGRASERLAYGLRREGWASGGLWQQTAIVPGDWFRTADWDEDAQADFEARLRRARPDLRPAYLRIKGLGLDEAGSVGAARQLWQRVIDEYPDSLDVGASLEHLGDSARTAGLVLEAEEHYRTLLRVRPTLNVTSHMAGVALAELLIEADEEEKVNEAVRLLEAWLGEMRLSSQLFRCTFLWQRQPSNSNDTETQQRAAASALALVDRGPQFSRHPDVGVVQADGPTLAWLQRLAAGDEPSTGGRRGWRRSR